MAADERDASVRMAAFAFLREKVRVYGDLLPRAELQRGFEYEGTRISLLGPPGIFKPAVLPDVPLSITTVPVVEGRQRPYEDEVRNDGWTTQAPVGQAVHPARWTQRLPISMKKRTWRRWSQTVSTVKKSTASIWSAC